MAVRRAGNGSRRAGKRSMLTFPHLRLRTEYSIRDGMLRLTKVPGSDNLSRRKDSSKIPDSMRPLAEVAAERGFQALGIADENNLFGAVKFHQSCLRSGIKPVIGCDLGLEALRNGGEHLPSMLLLCKDDTGYANLCRLITAAHEQGVRAPAEPHVSRSLQTAKDFGGLIALSGWTRGEIGGLLVAGDAKGAERIARHWKDVMGDRFYIEVQRIGQANEDGLVEDHVSLADRLGLPVACTHPVQFLDPEDFEAHEVRACIYAGEYMNDPDRPRRYSEQQYLKSPEEMAKLFHDLPEAIENAVEIVKRCNFRFEFGTVKLPEFARKKRDGLDERTQRAFAAIVEGQTPEKMEVYQERLRMETEIIRRMGFEDYFLIVADIVQWAKDNGIPVGPGRGSGAGSLAAYVLGITGLDPIRHGLLFERFLNPERVSMPDFDIDFCQDNRDRLIQHVRERFGQNCVSQICTFGTLGAKAVIRSAGRALGLPYMKCDQIARLIPFALDMTLEQAKIDNSELSELIRKEEEVERLFALSAKLEGLPRNVSTHAGGVLIAPDELVNHCPLYIAEETGGYASHYDKDDVEAIGLVKFDFLGLTTLTTITETVRNMERLDPSLAGFDPETGIPLDAPEIYRLFSKADTIGVFQSESDGMRSLMRRLKPDNFEEIVALISLFRPGPLDSGMADEYIDRKHKTSKIDLMHETLEGILASTYGVVVYQEQVMQVAQILAGYTLGEADLLRRAMGKKKPEEMAKHKERFVKGAADKLKGGRWAARKLFDRIEKFAGYGFNKSHAAAYALLAVRTAWLKANHPAAFFAAALSADMNNTLNIRKLLANAQEHGITVSPPDINASCYQFLPVDRKNIRFGLGAIKGMGRQASEQIVEIREAGHFKGINDFFTRIRDVPHLGRKALEMMVKAGALDSLHANRAEVLKLVELRSENDGVSKIEGQESLFGGEEAPAYIPREEAWDKETRFTNEVEATGLTLSGHFYEAYDLWVKRYCPKTVRLGDLAGTEKTLLLAGVVTGRMSTRGMIRKGIEVLVVEDMSGTVEVLVTVDMLKKCPEVSKVGRLLVAKGAMQWAGKRGSSGFKAERIWNRDQWVAERVQRVDLILDQQRHDNSDACVELLRPLLSPHFGGSCGVRVHCVNGNWECDIDLGASHRIKPEVDLLSQLESVLGVGCVKPVFA